MPPFVWELFVILVLILANGFFAGAEIAILSARRGRLQQRAEEGDRPSKVALGLAQDPNRFLPTVQVGITLVGTFAAAFGGATLVSYLETALETCPIGWVVEHRSSVALAIVAIGIAMCSLVIGELVPKRLALRNAEGLARIVALPMQALSVVARPAVWLMGLLTESVLFLLRARGKIESSVQVEDIEHLIETGTAEGILEPAEQKLALEALRLGETTVRQIMRPRLELDAIDVDTPPDEVIGTVAMAGFSRLPVYEKDLDHILGFVHIKDLFRQQYLGWPIDLRKLLHPALFVPETLTLDRLLERFQERRTQMAVVLDEFGGTEGVVTLENVFEELVGDIRDEHDRDRKQQIVQRDERSWLVDGRVPIEDLVEHLGRKLPPQNEPRGYSTLAGLILAELGRIPSITDRLAWDGLDLEVIDMDGQRIDRVLVSVRPPAPESSS
ncbi:MAG: HlyC/CorC family transporter [Planctomycetaceae bacterium]|nr:HlyC/CorC family transporter [Planctomycetaceae bacterium]